MSDGSAGGMLGQVDPRELSNRRLRDELAEEAVDSGDVAERDVKEEPPPTLEPLRMAAARLWAASKLPYLAAGLFAVPVLARNGIGTMSVDRAWILWADPEIVNGWSVPEIGASMLHLVSHLLRDHGDRAEAMGVKKDSARRWLRAADAEINDDLAVIDAMPRSASDVPRDFHQPANLLAETYFDVLGRIEDEVGRRGTLDCGSGADGQNREWEEGEKGLDRATQELAAQRVAQSIREESAADPGRVPAGWRRWAEERLSPRVNWRRELAAQLRRAVTSVAGRVDYTYRKPSRRASSTDRVILPGLHQPVPEVAVVCDTSGSMTDGLLVRALGEVEGLLGGLGLRKSVRVLACDAVVHTVARVSRASQVNLEGGGGTDMGEGIRSAMQLRPRPTIVVVLTDGFTPWPEQPPKGAKVVVGLLEVPQGKAPPSPPKWARPIRIDEPPR